jgi:CRISPR-associated protein Cas2
VLVVISYDVDTTDSNGRRRLRRIARACQDHGQRVQFSVFECEVTPAAWVALRQRLLGELEPRKDSLRFYFLGADGKRRIEHVGTKVPLDLDGPMLL